MKKVTLILLAMAVLTLAGCKDNQKTLYLPSADNDAIFTIIGGERTK